MPRAGLFPYFFTACTVVIQTNAFIIDKQADERAQYNPLALRKMSQVLKRKKIKESADRVASSTVHERK